MWVQSLGWEDPLEKEMQTYPSILAWKIPWTEEPDGLQMHGFTKSRTRLSTHMYMYIHVCVCVFKSSCPMDLE